jgi:hypothetical protein
MSDIKKYERIQKKLVKVTMKAEEEFKNTKQGTWRSIREHLGHWIDSINPMELVAVIALMPLVKAIILDPANNLLGTVKQRFDYAFTPSWELWKSGRIFRSPILQYFGLQPKDVQELIVKEEWQVWLASFGVSYLIVKYGGQMIGLLNTGLTGLTTLLLK